LSDVIRRAPAAYGRHPSVAAVLTRRDDEASRTGLASSSRLLLGAVGYASPP